MWILLTTPSACHLITTHTKIIQFDQINKQIFPNTLGSEVKAYFVVRFKTYYQQFSIRFGNAKQTVICEGGGIGIERNTGE